MSLVYINSEQFVKIRSSAIKNISTDFTKMMGCKYPIIAAPMFLVSNEAIVSAVSNFGAIGTTPALNFRPLDNYRKALKKIKQDTTGPVGANVIVNKSNQRQKDDLKIALDEGVELFITSLGSPKEVIAEAHKNGAKVICDVTNLEHAKKVQDLGADGVIAVASGAGGHAGPISSFILIPWLKKNLDIPIIAAGGIADGQTMAAALALGASGVSVGTRFIASHEATINSAYKEAIVNASPEDIVLSTKVSGTPASVINTEYIQKTGTDLHWALKILKNHPVSKKWVVPLIHLMGMKDLEKAAGKSTWKSVWSAGQTVGLIESVQSCEEILTEFVTSYYSAIENLPKGDQ